MIQGRKPAEITLQPSKLLLLWIVAIHSAVLVAVIACLDFSHMSLTLALVVVGFSLCYLRWRSPKWVGLVFNEGSWALIDSSGQQPVTVSWLYHFGSILILGFHQKDSIRWCNEAVVVLPDSSSASELTQLRRRLFIGGLDGQRAHSR